MDESSQKRNRTLDSVIAAINLAAMGAAAGNAKGKTESDDAQRVEKKIDELGAKIERIAEQIKGLQTPQQDQKIIVGSSSTNDGDKKPDGVQQAKPQDVIYVRKSNEFPFYS